MKQVFFVETATSDGQMAYINIDHIVKIEPRGLENDCYVVTTTGTVCIPLNIHEFMTRLKKCLS